MNPPAEKRKITYINKSEDAMIQNLKDAGCDMETIEMVMSDLQKGDEKSSLKLTK